MSSYELLELLEFMPQRGAFRTALRFGEFSEEEWAGRHTANEVARLRATMHAVHGGQRYEPPVLKSRAEQLAEVAVAERAAERRDDFFGFATRPSSKDLEAEHRLDDEWDGS